MEIGVKGLIAGRFEYTVALYDIDWSDIQIRSSCSSLALLCTVTGGDASVKGLEAELTAALTDSLRLIGGYTYTDATLEEAKGGLTGLAEDGARLPGSARHSGNVAVVSTTPLDGGLSLELTASLSYAGKRKTDVQSLEMETLPTYTVIDVSASVSSEHWSLGLFAKNLSDERSRISQLATFEGSGGWGAEAPAIARRPRTIGLSASYSF
ncbi:MAG: TonB-dependent receptor domain-containing protein, partial [Gammaproteobacteria bacterium]